MPGCENGSPARVKLYLPKRGHRGMIGLAVKWTSVAVWGTVALWGSLLLACDWQTLTGSERVVYTNGVIEGVRPPVSRSAPVWTELYGSGTRRLTTSNVKPRTFPGDYEQLPHNRDYVMNSLAPPVSDVERRHLQSFKESCEPRSAWHKYSFPTCNSMHELDMLDGLAAVPDLEEVDSTGELTIEYKFGGASRESWLLHTSCIEDGDCTDREDIILRTLRWPIEYDEVVYEHQRIDALVSERLAASPHVIDIYGFCGMSALNEFANGGNFGKMFRRQHQNMTTTDILEYATDGAQALADLHEIDGPGSIASIVHHDFSPKNFLTTNGKLKVSDFNDGQLLRWDFKADKRCFGFNWDGRCGTTTERTHRRSPEECLGDRFRYMTTEKVEVYHLGSFLFYLLTGGRWPYSFEPGRKNRPPSPEVKKLISKGQQPALPDEIENTNSTAVRAIAHAMRKAFTFDPRKRPSARKIADFLVNISDKIEQARHQ